MSILRLQLSQQEQGISWLELFYDLAYVAIIVALGDWLNHHISLEGIAGFLLIFVPVWRSWVGNVFFFLTALIRTM
jgi:low temperature requirement protein LtrA